MDQTITITHDGTLDIATGRSRKEVSWHNKEVQWSALVKKISVPHRTAETHAEYMASKKVRQDEIKDVGGFVGGYLTGGRRKTANVLHRQGQTKPVIIHHLVAPGTMDEDVMASLSRKGESQDALMEAVKARIKKYKK